MVAVAARPEGAFLSVLLRSQGNRPALLLEALTTLAAQTDDDFEVILLGHDLARPARDEIERLVGDFPQGFAARVALHFVDGGSRSRPLNVGLDVASGKYAAFLDDDDVVTAHWVETFRRAAATSPGSVLRARTVDQLVRRPERRELAPYCVEGPLSLHSGPYDPVEHLWRNQTTICSIAVPLADARRLELRFDESLDILEDWLFLLEAVARLGVTDIPEITSLYRRWTIDPRKRQVNEATWVAARVRVLDILDARPVYLPPRTFRQVAEALEERHHARVRAAPGPNWRHRAEVFAFDRLNHVLPPRAMRSVRQARKSILRLAGRR